MIGFDEVSELVIAAIRMPFNAMGCRVERVGGAAHLAGRDAAGEVIRSVHVADRCGESAVGNSKTLESRVNLRAIVIARLLFRSVRRLCNSRYRDRDDYANQRDDGHDFEEREAVTSLVGHI